MSSLFPFQFFFTFDSHLFDNIEFRPPKPFIGNRSSFDIEAKAELEKPPKRRTVLFRFYPVIFYYNKQQKMLSYYLSIHIHLLFFLLYQEFEENLLF